MAKKYRFWIAEETYSEEEGAKISNNCVDMKCFKRIISDLMKSEIDKLTATVRELSEKLTEEQTANKNLGKEVHSLKDEVTQLGLAISSAKRSMNPLVDAYNAQKATPFAKSKDAIDELYNLNTLFRQNVPYFGRGQKLEILQMLINYLYSPSVELERTIINESHHDEKAISILEQVNSFNKSHKPVLINYLESENTNWKNCVYFPNRNIYIPEEMGLYTDVTEIKPGETVYIVSLGLDFPNSNSEKQKPLVFKATK